MALLVKDKFHSYSHGIPLVVGALEAENCRKATYYGATDFVVKATAPQKRGRDRSRTIIVTWGKPNYAEREFIKNCLAAGEPFPVKKVQLKHWPEKRDAKR